MKQDCTTCTKTHRCPFVGRIEHCSKWQHAFEHCSDPNCTCGKHRPAKTVPRLAKIA